MTGLFASALQFGEVRREILTRGTLQEDAGIEVFLENVPVQFPPFTAISLVDASLQDFTRFAESRANLGKGGALLCVFEDPGPRFKNHDTLKTLRDAFHLLKQLLGGVDASGDVRQFGRMHQEPDRAPPVGTVFLP